MVKPAFVILAALLLTLQLAAADGGPPPPLPGLTPTSTAIHNGSLMTIYSDNRGRIEIRYAEPRPGLWELGVAPGTLLLVGQWRGAMLYATAYVFSFCGPIPYQMAGSQLPDGQLQLTGPAPIVDPFTCRVLDLGWTENAVLTFYRT